MMGQEALNEKQISLNVWHIERVFIEYIRKLIYKESLTIWKCNIEYFTLKTLRVFDDNDDGDHDHDSDHDDHETHL